MSASSAIQMNINYQTEKDVIRGYFEKEPQAYIPKDHAIVIDLDEIEQYNHTLCDNIEQNTKRYTSLFCDVVDSLIPESDHMPDEESSPLQVLLYQRSRRNEQIRLEQQNAEEAPAIAEPLFPAALTRKYTLTFKPRQEMPSVSVRQIKGESIGKMMKIKGIVTRISNVKPLAIVSAYSCDACGNEVFQDVNSQQWQPLDTCPSAQCKKNATKGRLHLQTRGCKFLKFQEVKLQELTDQVPMGHIPRSMTIHLTEHLTRSIIPGETVVISGVMLPIPFSGYKALKAGLITDTYLEAHHVYQLKAQYAAMDLTSSMREEIEELVRSPGLYDRLAQSIAPEIYGHEDVKKALMLMLVGGTTKETADGMKVRGDLNICLMGDPGVAKSQLLKHICKIAPRAVYTTGRGSSGVGLTASVTRDPVTEEMVLEGGALVLADNGIACIDEFDKMDETDRTAIHEVMEQQTISISKAGITTTLNARTSILAAANPQYGRYNKNMKVTDNINLPAALLSRFDLLFLLLDQPSIEADLRLAQHVTFVHRCLHHPKREGQEEPLEPLLMKNYIAKARMYNPTVPSHVADYVVNAYVNLRNLMVRPTQDPSGRYNKDKRGGTDFQYTTARSLLAIIRLSSALARLRFADCIQISDVDEALRLIEVSKASVANDDIIKKKIDPTSVIFNLIKEMSTKADGDMESEIPLVDILERVINKGYSEDDLKKCLDSYALDDVWFQNNGTLQWMRIGD